MGMRIDGGRGEGRAMNISKYLPDAVGFASLCHKRLAGGGNCISGVYGLSRIGSFYGTAYYITRWAGCVTPRMQCSVST